MVASVPLVSAWETILQLSPLNPQIQKFIWAADLIYKAYNFKDLEDYSPWSAIELVQGSEIGAFAINTIARLALGGLAIYFLNPAHGSDPQQPQSTFLEKFRYKASEDPFLNGTISHIPPRDFSSLHPNEVQAQQLWGSNILNFQLEDPRPKFLTLTAAYDWNEAFSPQNRDYFVSPLLEPFDFKYRVFDHPFQICHAIRELGKKGKLAAISIEAHGTPDGIMFDRDMTWFKGEYLPSQILPYCFRDNSPESTLLLFSCNTAKKTSKNSVSFAEYLFKGAEKQGIAPKGKPTYLFPENPPRFGNFSTRMYNANGADITVFFKKDGTLVYGADEVSSTIKDLGVGVFNLSVSSIFSLLTAWKMLRMGASGLSFGSKICNYADTHALRHNQTSRFVSACLDKGSKLLQKSGENAHKILDTIKNETLNQLSFVVFPTCLRNCFKRTIRSAGQYLGCLKKPVDYGDTEKFEEQSGGKTAQTAVHSYKNSFRTAKFTFSTKEGTGELYGFQSEEGENLRWTVYVDEKGHPPFATNYEVSSFEQAKEKFKEILACRLIAPFDTFLLTSLEKFHNRLKTYPGFPK